MGQATDGQLPADTLGYRAEGVYVPGTGTVAQQGGTVLTDSNGTNYAATVVTTISGSTTAISANNTGLPVNVPVIIQKTSNASTGSVATLAKAFANTNTSGNSIIVVCGCGNGTAMTVADSAGNTYTQAETAPNSTTFETAIFYAVGIVGGANTVTVTNAGSTASIAMEIYEVSGLLAQVVGQPDQSSTGTGTGTTASTSALAASSPNSLAFLGVGVGTAAQAVSVTSGTSWTLDSTQNPTTPAGLFTFGALSQYLASTTPVIPKATLAGSEPYAAVAAIFKPVVLGVQGIVTIGGYTYTNITSATTTLIKTGAGTLHSITINTPVASGVCEFDDALTHTTPKIGTITLPATLLSDGPKNAVYDVGFTTGLSITTTGVMDITVAWK